MRELSVVEQRYQAVLAVISDGETVTDVAARFGVRRQTVHEWLARYEGGGLEGLADRSHRLRSCPHRMPAAAEVAVLELRRAHPSWGRGGCTSRWPSGSVGAPYELWQMDTVGGFLLADRSRAKALTGIDDPPGSVQRVPDAARGCPAGLCGAGVGDAQPQGARGDPHRQLPCLHRPVQPSAGGGALRPDPA